MIIENLKYAWSYFSKAKETETVSCDFLCFQRDKAIPHRVSNIVCDKEASARPRGMTLTSSPLMIQGEGQEGLAGLQMRGVEVGLGFAVVL